MRTALFALLIAATPASAWWGPWGHRYYGYRWHGYYAAPSYYSPMYYAPTYYAPMSAACWCECPPASPMPRATPARMPEKATAPNTVTEIPFSPITPASLNTPAEDKIPKPMPAVETPPVKKEELKPEIPAPPTIVLPSAAPPKVELPAVNPPAPKLELPPLPSTSKYRAAAETTIVAVRGATPQDGRYSVAFRNHLDRDVTVMVDGATITLPAKHTTTATVGSIFRWSVDDAAVTAASVPAGASGAEVVIR